MKFRSISILVLVFVCLTGSSYSQTSPPPPVQSLEQSPQPTEMVLIPGGEFTMGSETGKFYQQHKVSLPAFYMDKTEVTNAQYLVFCAATDRKMPLFWGMDEFRSTPDFPDIPVVGVSYRDATAYAKWAGKRLPTEAEWEYAARGGLEGMKFDNGNELTIEDANYTKSAKNGPIEVGSYRPNGYGLHDTIGNVREWASDWYDMDYYQNSPLENPPGPEIGRFRVIRGGGWHAGGSCQTVYSRWGLHPGWGDFNVGFRCAKSVVDQ